MYKNINVYYEINKLDFYIYVQADVNAVKNPRTSCIRH